MTQSERSDSTSTPADQAPALPRSKKPFSTAEWISLGVASTLLLGVIGVVSALWASDRHQQPPILEVSQAEVRQANGQYYVPYEVTNAGGETAESVQVVGELQVNGAAIESGEQIIDFLSSQEKADGAFVFTQDPQTGEVVIRVASYQNP